jgi:hypothetical protein
MAYPGSSDTRVAAGGPPGGAPSAQSEWPVQATDAIVRVVDSVRDKTTGPALDAARWFIYGIVLALLALPLAILLLVGAMRLTEGFFLWLYGRGVEWLHDPMWLVYAIYGGLFSLTGLVCWRKAKKPAPAT